MVGTTQKTFQRKMEDSIYKCRHSINKMKVADIKRDGTFTKRAEKL